MNKIQITLTEGAIRHSYLRVPPEFFPTETHGGSNKGNAAVRRFKIITDTGESLDSDYDATKGFVRARFGTYFREAGLHPNDVLTIERISDYEYRLYRIQTRVLLFKYRGDAWAKLDEIKQIFAQDGYDFQRERFQVSYGSIRPANGDVCICMSNDRKQLDFVCRLRTPSKNPKGLYDYIEPLFFEQPVDYSDVFDDPPYRVFKPANNGENERTVLFNLSDFPDKLSQLRSVIFEKNKPQAEEIAAYLGGAREAAINHPAEKGNNASAVPKNLILFGPPGTGKTYQTKSIALNIISEVPR